MHEWYDNDKLAFVTGKLLHKTGKQSFASLTGLSVCGLKNHFDTMREKKLYGLVVPMTYHWQYPLRLCGYIVAFRREDNSLLSQKGCVTDLAPFPCL